MSALVGTHLMFGNNFLQFCFIPIPAIRSLFFIFFVLAAEAGCTRGYFRMVLLIDFVELVVGVRDIEILLKSESNVSCIERHILFLLSELGGTGRMCVCREGGDWVRVWSMFNL